MSNLYRAMLLAEERRKAQEAAKTAPSVEAPVVGPKPVGRPKSSRPKTIISIRLDAEIVDHYRATGAGWQSRINEDLKKAVGLEKSR